MRRNAISSAVQEEESEINLTPMLDVVFIMLIFFIVTANFIKEPGLEINRPDAETSEVQENAAILIAVGPTGEIWMDGRRIDARQVKANVVKLLADNPQGSVVIQADEKAMADTIIQVDPEEHTSELQSHSDLVCRLLLEKKNKNYKSKKK